MSRPRFVHHRALGLIRRDAFTLIELLTVVAIIGLLVGILVPALSRAREQARNTSTRAAMKAMGDGLELFRNDNPTEVRAEGYPSSAAADDPTEQGQQFIYGAQWLVRYLMGKDLRGYVAKQTGRGIPATPEQYYEQQDWYSISGTPANPKAPLSRQSLYINPDQLKLAAPKDLPGAASPAPFGFGHVIDEKSMQQLVALDPYGYPILYYAANTALAGDALAPIATYGITASSPRPKPGIYSFSDNAMFTGACRGTNCTFQPWSFTGDTFGAGEAHGIQNFGEFTDDVPNAVQMRDPKNKTDTFVSYIMDKQVYEKTGGDSSTRPGTLAPVRKSSFIMISAGKDGIYGTADDVNNF